ncbi:MAG TPA: zinc ribbon domain-containing protein [Anaerolineae bacterium]
MPIYEYTCSDCQSQVEIFFRTMSEVKTKEPVCPECQGSHLERLISSVAVVQSGPAKAAGQTPQAMPVKDDSRALAQTMRQAGQAAGQDLGRDFNEVAKRLERGEKATSVEKSLRKRVGEKMSPH